MSVEQSCNTCVHHVQGRPLDECPAHCWDCGATDSLIHWEPIEFTDKPLSLTEYVAALTPDPKPASALDVQVSGDHYKQLKIQPIEFIHANNIPFAEGSVIKYVTRWRSKNGIKDLEKAKHFIELLIELERKEVSPES